MLLWGFNAAGHWEYMDKIWWPSVLATCNSHELCLAKILRYSSLYFFDEFCLRKSLDDSSPWGSNSSNSNNSSGSNGKHSKCKHSKCRLNRCKHRCCKHNRCNGKLSSNNFKHSKCKHSKCKRSGISTFNKLSSQRRHKMRVECHSRRRGFWDWS